MMTTKKPSYVGGDETAAVSSLPSYISAMNGRDDGRPKPRIKTMAEQTGEKSSREKVQAYEAKAVETPVEVHAAAEDREIQPPGFQPVQFLQQRIKEFLDHPMIKNGYRLYQRIVFETVDIPAFDIAEAYRLKFVPEVLLGKERERSTTRLFMKFAVPGPDSVLDALEKILTTIHDWDAGEKRYGKEGNYYPKLFVYGTFDYPEEVVAVIA